MATRRQRWAWAVAATLGGLAIYSGAGVASAFAAPPAITATSIGADGSSVPLASPLAPSLLEPPEPMPGYETTLTLMSEDGRTLVFREYLGKQYIYSREVGYRSGPVINGKECFAANADNMQAPLSENAYSARSKPQKHISSMKPNSTSLIWPATRQPLSIRQRPKTTHAYRFVNARHAIVLWACEVYRHARWSSAVCSRSRSSSAGSAFHAAARFQSEPRYGAWRWPGSHLRHDHPRRPCHDGKRHVAAPIRGPATVAAVVHTCSLASSCSCCSLRSSVGVDPKF